jgi:hypothetical protein
VKPFRALFRFFHGLAASRLKKRAFTPPGRKGFLRVCTGAVKS